MSILENLFLSQLRIFLMREANQDNKIATPDAEFLSDLLRLSTQHSVTPIMADTMFKNDLLVGDAAEAYRQISYVALIKWRQQETEFAKISALFEKHKISYMPLKGAVLRKFYPEPWMRTSCDIDILIHEEQLQAAKTLLVDELGYREDNKTDHDVMLIAPNGVHFELHYDFSEKQVSAREVWETATHQEGSYRYEMLPELFYLHHLAHMAKHFVLGGCGIRTLIDLWLMQQNMPCDANRLRDILKQNDLNLFADKMFGLLSAWLGGEELTDMQQKILSYVVRGGVYGNLDNRVAVSHSRRQNIFLYVFRRVFPNYNSMVYLYPVLRKHPALMPFCQVHRWIHLLNRNKFKRAGTELKSVQQLDSEQLHETSTLLQELGL